MIQNRAMEADGLWKAALTRALPQPLENAGGVSHSSHSLCHRPTKFEPSLRKALSSNTVLDVSGFCPRCPRSLQGEKVPKADEGGI